MQSVAAVARGNITKLLGYTVNTTAYDISSFNSYVKQQIQDLSARGEEFNDLLYHLFQAYMKCPDEPFFIYIQHQKDHYEDVTINIDANIDAESRATIQECDN